MTLQIGFSQYARLAVIYKPCASATMQPQLPAKLNMPREAKRLLYGGTWLKPDRQLSAKIVLRVATGNVVCKKANPSVSPARSFQHPQKRATEIRDAELPQ